MTENQQMTRVEDCDVVIAGGGPGGMLVANLLSRINLHVILLEKYGDFLRDWRGDTVHPTTLQLIDKMGLGDEFSSFPTGRLRRMRMRFNDNDVTIADFRLLPMKHKYIAMVPQWDLLNMLAEDAQKSERCDIRLNAEVKNLVKDSQRRQISGVVYATGEGRLVQVNAKLTVGADGRWSAVTRDMRWRLKENPIEIDAWQVCIPKSALGEWHEEVLGSYKPGLAAVAQDRHDYVQTAFLIKKGTDSEKRARGVEWLRQSLVELYGWPQEAVDAIRSLDDVPFLEIKSGILPRWYVSGLICIGDAAHPMSPAGGVGINCAIQDALSLANLIAEKWDDGLGVESLKVLQGRRRRATKLVQNLQKGEERGVIMPALNGEIKVGSVPPFLQTFKRATFVKYISPVLSTFVVLPERLNTKFVRRGVA